MDRGGYRPNKGWIKGRKKGAWVKGMARDATVGERASRNWKKFG